MAFHGDLFSYPLPELLQWVDSSRKSGTLLLSWQAGERKLFVLAGNVLASSSGALWERIARALELGSLASGQVVLEAFAEMRRTGEPDAAFRRRGLEASLAAELARDELYGAVTDLTANSGGQFHWTEDADRSGDEWVALELPLRHLLFESMRWVDEQVEVDRLLPLDSMTVRSVGAPAVGMPLVHRIILSACREGQNLGRLRLALGISRSATTRRVFDLLRAGQVEVEGVPSVGVDPISEMLEKGATLIREGQHAAAALIGQALVSSDPSDRRVREFVRMVEREHVAFLYRELPPLFVAERVDSPEILARLLPEERQVTALLNGRWDIATLVLASPIRELETLKCLSKLARLGALREAELRRAAAPRPKAG